MGEWKKGKLNRFNDDLYEGSIYSDGKEEKMDGKGKLIKANGEIYEGNFYMDTMNGVGCYYYTDGSFFVGNWQWGQRQKGVMIHSDGTAEEWKYKNGELVGKKSLSADDPAVVKAMKKKKTTVGDSAVKVTPKPSANDSKKETVKKTDKVITPVTKETNVATTKNKTEKQLTESKKESEKPIEKGAASSVASVDTHKRIEMDNGDIYEGDLCNGVPHGKGTLSKENGTYVGEFADGVYHGYGKLSFDNGVAFEGNWVAGKLQGVAKYTLRGGFAVFECEKINGEFEGFGKADYKDGTHYEGEFHLGAKHGKGKLTSPNGEVFEGTFMQDNPESGILYYTDGRCAEVVYKDGKIIKEVSLPKNAKTVSASPVEKQSVSAATPKNQATVPSAGTTHKRIEMDNGDIYEGDYANGQFNGQGTYTSHKGWVYVGKWQNGAMTDGKLTFTASGNIFDGHFENGVLHGYGKAVYHTQEAGKYVYGSTYEGEWQNGKRHGKGKYTYADGTYYDGEWKEGEKHGNSVYTTKSGTYTLLHNGRWDMGKKTGAHDYYSITNPKKTLYRQFFENGETVGSVFSPVGEYKNWTAADALAQKKKIEDENLQYWENKKTRDEAASTTATASSTPPASSNTAAPSKPTAATTTKPVNTTTKTVNNNTSTRNSKHWTAAERFSFNPGTSAD